MIRWLLAALPLLWAWQPQLEWKHPTVLVRFHPETGYTYAADASGQVTALDEAGREVAANQWAWKGRLIDIDALQGGECLLTFEGTFSSVVVDPYLGERLTIDWADYLPWEVQAVCASRYGWLWIYDAASGRLRRLNRRMEVEFESAPLSHYEAGAAAPTFMRERDGRLYTAIPGSGIWVWDIYGNFLYRLPHLLDGEFWIDGATLYYPNNGQVWAAPADGGGAQPLTLPGLNTAVEPVRSITVWNQRLWTATDRRLMIWAYD